MLSLHLLQLTQQRLRLQLCGCDARERVGRQVMSAAHLLQLAPTAALQLARLRTAVLQVLTQLLEQEEYYPLSQLLLHQKSRLCFFNVANKVK